MGKFDDILQQITIFGDLAEKIDSALGVDTYLRRVDVSVQEISSVVLSINAPCEGGNAPITMGIMKSSICVVNQWPFAYSEKFPLANPQYPDRVIETVRELLQKIKDYKESVKAHDA